MPRTHARLDGARGGASTEGSEGHLGEVEGRSSGDDGEDVARLSGSAGAVAERGGKSKSARGARLGDGLEGGSDSLAEGAVGRLAGDDDVCVVEREAGTE